MCLSTEVRVFYIYHVGWKRRFFSASPKPSQISVITKPELVLKTEDVKVIMHSQLESFRLTSDQEKVDATSQCTELLRCAIRSLSIRTLGLSGKTAVGTMLRLRVKMLSLPLAHNLTKLELPAGFDKLGPTKSSWLARSVKCLRHLQQLTILGAVQTRSNRFSILLPFCCCHVARLDLSSELLVDGAFFKLIRACCEGEDLRLEKGELAVQAPASLTLLLYCLRKMIKKAIKKLYIHKLSSVIEQAKLTFMSNLYRSEGITLFYV